LLVGIIEAFDEAVTDGASHGHTQVGLVKVEPALYHSVFYVINNLLLYKPSFVAEVGAHEAPQLGINIVTV
jgi:hypothetical protein